MCLLLIISWLKVYLYIAVVRWTLFVRCYGKIIYFEMADLVGFINTLKS